MRTLTAIVFLVLSFAVSAQEKLNAFHVFLANPSFTQSDSTGNNFSGAVGVAYQRRVARVWAVELAVARATDRETIIHYDHNGNVVETRRSTSNTTPVDAAAFYQFPNDTSWKPYLGAVVREIDSNLLYGVGGGVVWQFGQSLGLRFDGRILGGDRPSWVDQFNASAGVTWRF